MNPAEAMVSFLIALRASGGKRGPISETTLRGYVNDLTLFFRRVPGSLEDISRDHVRLFLANPGWSAATRLIRWKSLDTFFRFLVADGILYRSPVDQVERPRGAKKARRPDRLTEQDMQTLLLCWPEWTWMGLRNRAILWCFFTMPFRLSELAGLAASDVDLVECRARARRSKGSDEGYTATIFPKAAFAIDRYRRRLPEEFRETPSLWITRDGNPMHGHAIQQMLRRTEARARQAGFSKHFWAHAYRHAWGMQTVHWGLATDVAGRSMGHKTDDAAKLYRQWVAVDEAELQIRKIAGLSS